MNNSTSLVKNKIISIRLRTWTLTLAVLISIIFYFFVTVITKSVNWIDFILLCTIQIVFYTIYFSEGELSGQRDLSFIANKTAYNEKATKVNESGQISQLRKYCEYEYEERKKKYIYNECGYIGISYEELQTLKKLTEKQIKRLKHYEFTEQGNNNIVGFSKQKRKRLHSLIFKEIPVERNVSETILSGVENNGIRAIYDGSQSFKTKSFIQKLFKAVIVGGVFAYVGYGAKDGVGLTEVVQICISLTTLFTTAVMAFSSGEKCSKVFRNQYYLELVMFIDNFFEWNS